MLIEEIYLKNPETVDEDEKIEKILQNLNKERFNGYLVTDREGKLSGILALQDIAGATVPKEFRDNPAMALAMPKKGFFRERCREIKDKKVSEVMRKDFLKVNLSTNIMAVMADFLKNDLYIIPVVDDNNKPIGIVTRNQVKKALILGIERSYDL